MPEGDTIFRSARALDRALAGKPVTRFETVVAKLAVADDNHVIAGRTVQRVEARGKWLLMFFSGDLILLTHMLMNGSWHIYRIGERWRRARRDMRIVIETLDWMAVGFTVPVAEFHSTASLQRKEQVVSLGPDLLRAEFREDDALNSIRSRGNEEIAVALLNQRVIAGIGNVFKSEICFACRVHPFRRIESLTHVELDDIVHTSRKLLNANVVEDANGKRATFTGARSTINSLDRSARLWVYGRRGEPCRRCGTAILMRKQGTEARTTFWCPSCQPLAPIATAPMEGWSHLRGGKSIM